MRMMVWLAITVDVVVSVHTDSWIPDTGWVGLPACIVTHKLFIYKQTCQQRCYYLQKLQFVKIYFLHKVVRNLHGIAML